jgi:hypothetical protein
MDQVDSKNSTAAPFIREADMDTIENITFTPALVEKFGTSESLLLMSCAQWHAARADHLMVMATHDLSTGWGNLGVINFPDMSSLREMEKLQSSISQLRPNTQLGLRQMLEIAVTIMSYPNPEISLGQGSNPGDR